MSTASDLKVVDLSRVLAGPWASQTLADLGAEVIKIEKPKCGDDTRHWGPPYIGGEGSDAAYFVSTNRGKKSLELDFTHHKDKQKLISLITDADVVIENYKPDTLSRYGLDYESLIVINPRLIYCSISGFGQTGPYKTKPGYDFLMQAMGGLMSVTGQPNGTPGGGPVKVGVALTDIMTGLYATIGILAAVNERHTSGLGQYIDLALFDVTVGTLANQASNYLNGNIIPSPQGNTHPNIVPYQSFDTADYPLIIAVGNNTQFEGLCDVLALQHLAKDSRFSLNQHRVANREILTEQLQSKLLTHPREFWLNKFSQSNIPAGPINNLQQVFDDPQVTARNMLLSMPHEDAGEVKMVANPLNFSRTPITYDMSPPKLGQHNNLFKK